jgi:AhpD family alkylhydroperoxidase
MSRLSVPNLESDTGVSGQLYAQIKKAIGSVPNTFAAIAAHGPAALKAVLAADAVLATGSLTKRDQEVIKLVISAASGCDYCVAAHTHLAKLAGAKPEPLKQIRQGQPSGDTATCWPASSVSSRSPAAPSATRISPRSRPPATATTSWSKSAWPSQPPSSPMSSIASTTPRSTSPQSREAAAPCSILNKRITTMTTLARNTLASTTQNPIVLALHRSGLLADDLDYHVVRASMVILYFFFGYQKWFPYEFERLVPFISNGPLIWWLHPVFGHAGASYFLGTSEWTFGSLLLAGFWDKRLGVLGALGSTGTFIATVTIIPFMPEGWDVAAGGFPAMTGNVPFLMKDVVLLAVSLYLLRQDVVRLTRQ